MAKIETPPGSTVEEVKRTRVLPAAERSEGESLDFWGYQATLTPDDWQNHITYVYRWLENGEREAVAKYSNAVDEFYLREHHGGGSYRLMMKKGAQIVKVLEKCRVEGPPKPYTPPAPVATINAGAADTNSINRLCDLLEKVVLQNAQNGGQTMINEAMKTGLGLQADAFRGVVTNVREVLNPPGAPAAPASDPLRDKLLDAAINKLLNPTDPIQTFASMLAAMKGLGLNMDGSAAGGKSSIGVELIRAAREVVPQLVDGMKAYTGAVSRQADVQALAISRGIGGPPPPAAVAPQQPGQPAPPAPQPTVAPAAPPAADPGQPQTVSREMTGDDVERYIALLIVNDRIPVSAAAEDALNYLENVSDQLFFYICSMDEAQLTQFMNSRPILATVPRNPRFSEFIKKIVEIAHRDDPPAEPAATTASTSPQTPA